MANPLPWILDKVKSLNHTLWHTSLSDLSKGRSFVIKQSRIIVLAIRGFLNNKVQLRAASLTLYSLLSIIPVVAIAFAIAKGFGLDQNLQQVITKEFKTQPEVLNWVLTEATNALQKTRGGYLAGVGVIILFWSVMSLLGQIESSFNHIWEIRGSRTWYRKFTDYLTIMLITPVFLILSSSITLFVSTQLTDYLSKAEILDVFKPVVGFLVKFAPYFLTSVALTVVFIVMPNTRVKFVPALVAGIVTGTILQIIQWLYIDLQFGISKLSAIYGSFAAIPLFIAWLQVSWTIILIGAELSFANQNVSRYEFESEALNVSNYQKRALVLMILNMIIKSFSAGDKPISAEKIAGSLRIPLRLVNDILQDLSNADLISVIQEDEHQERFFQPALDINKMTVSYVISRLDRKGTKLEIFARGKEYEKVISMLDKFDKLVAKSNENILVKDL
jgi:membrane protein